MGPLMRAAGVLVLSLCASSLRADFSYSLRVTTVAHPLLGLKTKESKAYVAFQGELAASRQNDIVTVVNPTLNLITLIDYRASTFATSNLDEVQRADDQGFDSIETGIRSELVQSGEPAMWNGIAVKRDVSRTVLTGGPAPGEVRITSDWIDNIAGYEQISHAFDAADDRHAMEIEAEINTLVLTHADRLADGLKIRKGAAGHSAFQVHSLSEMRLAPGAAMLEALGPEYASKPVLSRETEVLNLSTEPVDPAIFQVPRDFNKVEFMGLLLESVNRRNH